MSKVQVHRSYSPKNISWVFLKYTIVSNIYEHDHFQTYFQVHFQNIYIFIWLQALSNKLCRIKNQKKCEIFAIFVFLLFVAPPLQKQ